MSRWGERRSGFFVPLSEQEVDFSLQANEQLFPTAVAMLPPNGADGDACYGEYAAWRERKAVEVER